MAATKREYYCPGCLARKRAAKAPWCKCNPGAPFRMEDIAVDRLVSGLLRLTPRSMLQPRKGGR